MRAPRRPGYIRTRYSSTRVSDMVWQVLRRTKKSLTADEIAARAGVSVWSARHLLARWEREGLVQSDGPRQHGDGGRLLPRSWTIRVRAPRAPVLHGTIYSGEGHTLIGAE